MDCVKRRWPRPVGIEVAREVCSALRPACERLVVAGSLRRRKDDIGDVEIVYVSASEIRPDPEDFFRNRSFSLADEAIEALVSSGTFVRRLNSKGTPAFGPKNKLVRHVDSGMPVDLFATTDAAWWNYLVCRTGPADSNVRIAKLAQARGYQWKPYGEGFSRVSDGALIPMQSEREVFQFVGLPYLEPWER